MEAAGSSEKMVYIYQSAQCHMPEDSNLHCHCCENFKPHTVVLYEATLQTHSSSLNMETAGSSKTPVNICHTTQRHISEKTVIITVTAARTSDLT
jgi:hypothetical protein